MKTQGFTLLEVLLSVAMIAIIATFSSPLYVNLMVRNDLDIATTTTAQSLRRASILALGSDGDSRWGIRMVSGQIVIFKGSSYATRDTTYDEVYAISPAITLGGTSEIVFEEVTGFPLGTGSITLTANADTKTVTINSKGMVNF